MDSLPLASVIIPTRDRPVAIVDAVRSVLSGQYRHLEVIVIDQSATDQTRRALTIFQDDPRLHYHVNRRLGVGAPSSRNIGLALSRGDVIAMIDDDVEVRPDWLARMVAEFQADPQLDFILGRLTAPPFDPDAGHIPEFVPHAGLSSWRLIQVAANANVGLRQRLLTKIGGYDELIGPGGRLGAADDSDLLLRVVLSGARWKACPQIEVIHTHGFRPHRPGHARHLDYQDGIGAVFGRAARRRRLRPTLYFAAREGYQCLVALMASLRGHPADWPAIRLRLAGFIQGFRCQPAIGYVGPAELANLSRHLRVEAPFESPRVGQQVSVHA